MDYNRIKILLEKYFDAETTVSEEKELKTFFTHEKEIPQEFEFAQSMFAYIKKEQAVSYSKAIKYEKSNKRIFYYISSVAASILIILSTYFLFQKSDNQVIYAYVNGKAITDKNVAAKYSIDALLKVSQNLDNGTKNLNYLNQLNKVEKLIKSKNK